MNLKTYFNKTNTIIYNSTHNTGNNPVCELYYGDGYTRVLIHIDIDRIASMVEDKTFSDVSKLKHTIKMKNCWGLELMSEKLLFNSGKETSKERTSSFDLNLLRMPQTWDAGTGSDFTRDGFITNNYSISENGSNWVNSATETPWVEGDGAISGITGETIIATQHFDQGNEDIEFDVTNEINSILTGNTENYGFMICFPNLLEQTDRETTQYVGFFTNKTTSFYKPYLETVYSETIIDDRYNFYLNKDNKLYFYSNVGGSPQNLDELPVCTIEDEEFEVKQATKGVYYIELNLSSEDYTEETMLYDIWSNIIFNGRTFPEVEQEFMVKLDEEYFNFNNTKVEEKKYVPTVYGIKHSEKLNIGDVRKVFIDPREQYTTNKVEHITEIEYRVYVKEGNKELTVIDYLPANRTLNTNYFLIDTQSLLPNKYFIDIKISKYGEVITHKERLVFEIVNEI